jgi:hypothetical protein
MPVIAQVLAISTSSAVCCNWRVSAVSSPFAPVSSTPRSAADVANASGPTFDRR